MARVTVIIPTFNRASYLEEAIASAASQDLPDVVVSVADNASDDDTPRVAERTIDMFGPERVQYLRRGTNVGWHANFNLSLAQVDTEFALVLGDDDRLMSGALRRAVAGADAAPTAGIVHAAFETIDEHGDLVATATDWTKGLVSDTLEPGQIFIGRTIPWPSRVFTHSTLIRRAAFQEPMFDPADGLVADYVLWLRIALDWDVAYVARPGAQRRVHRGGMSSAFGGVVGTDYVLDPESIMTLRTAKLRFVDRYGTRLDDPSSLRRAARTGSGRDLAAFARTQAWISRRAGISALRRAVVTQPSVVAHPWTWRALGKVVLGPQASARLTHR